MKVCITGANGFVGKSLTQLLVKHQYSLLLATRSEESNPLGSSFTFDLANVENLYSSLVGCDVVVHLAAHVHQMNNCSQHSENEYFKFNTQASVDLMNQAILAGVKRFIYVSSVKVFGESSPLHHPFTEKDVCSPKDAYGLSKLKAEAALLNIAKKSAIEVVIIRPPLVYGKGVKANFASLLKLVKYGIPLPFGAVSNKRSLIYVGNLAHFIMHCLTHPAAKNEVFSISDDHDVSTAYLIQEIARALNVSNRNFNFPEKWLFRIAQIFGKQKQMMRLCGNLRVDISKAKNLIGWQPPFTLAESLKHTVEDHVS